MNKRSKTTKRNFDEIKLNHNAMFQISIDETAGDITIRCNATSTTMQFPESTQRSGTTQKIHFNKIKLIENAMSENSVTK